MASIVQGMMVWVHFAHLIWMKSSEKQSVPLRQDPWDDLIFDEAEEKETKTTQWNINADFSYYFLIETMNSVILAWPHDFLKGTFQIWKYFKGLCWVPKKTLSIQFPVASGWPLLRHFQLERKDRSSCFLLSLIFNDVALWRCDLRKAWVQTVLLISLALFFIFISKFQETNVS